MKLQSYVLYRDSAFVATVDPKSKEPLTAFVAYVVTGENEFRRVLGDVEQDSDVADAVKMVRQWTLPKWAEQPTIKIPGHAVYTINNEIARWGWDQELANMPLSYVYTVFLPRVPHINDGVLSYCDPKGEHTIAVVYSKQQAMDELRGLPWLSVGKLRGDEKLVLSCSLPETGGDPPIRITGGLAAHFNKAAMVRKTMPNA